MNIKSIDLEVALKDAESDLEAKNIKWLKALAIHNATLKSHKEEISKLKWNIADAEADYEHACEAYDTLLEDQKVLPNET